MKFLLWYIISLFTGHPLLALGVVILVFYLLEAQRSGRFFNPYAFIQKGRQIADLRRTVQINPHDATAHNRLGVILAQKGKFEEASSHLKQAIEKNRKIDETNCYLGLALIKTGEADLGLKQIQAGLEINPKFGYGDPYIWAADHYLEVGKIAEARVCLEKATAIHSSSSEAFYKLGLCAQRENNEAAASEMFERAIKAFETSPRYKKRVERPWASKAKSALKKSKRT